ncbi:MAG: hypothetical protein A3J80_05445 [Desulfobacula sp. RIFOXYB2_FULL_45_6]|nr:MAG: hypothetical protein A3J80_05445 [Desulfobacula sp. RIFOXYB2_FULL_45_6]
MMKLFQNIRNTDGPVALIFTDARRDGAADILKASSGITLVAVQPGNFDRSKACDVTTNLHLFWKARRP